MKVIFTLVCIYFCLSAMEGHSEKGIQYPKAKVQLKADSIGAESRDSILTHSITINGQLNSVSIANNNPLVKDLEVKDKNSKANHTIKINGDSNAVNINQNNQDGKVNIQQKGNGNQINVSQSKIKAIRQEE